MLTELRCSNCNRKLLNVDGSNTYIEIKCPRCKNLISYDMVTNIVRNKGTRDYSLTEEYQTMRKRVTSSGHRFEN